MKPRTAAKPMISQVCEKWSARLEEWRRLGIQVSGQGIAAEILADLESIEAANRDDAISIPEATRISGYSADHLRRLIREGTLENLGRKHAPRLRRSDLPKKTRAISRSSPQMYDAVVDARTLAGRQGDR